MVFIVLTSSPPLFFLLYYCDFYFFNRIVTLAIDVTILPSLSLLILSHIKRDNIILFKYYNLLFIYISLLLYLISSYHIID